MISANWFKRKNFSYTPLHSQNQDFHVVLIWKSFCGPGKLSSSRQKNPIFLSLSQMLQFWIKFEQFLIIMNISWNSFFQGGKVTKLEKKIIPIKIDSVSPKLFFEWSPIFDVGLRRRWFRAKWRFRDYKSRKCSLKW